ncbi:hypothetical protein VTK26DRAFT_9510 [Humicola hyalothermophila]
MPLGKLRKLEIYTFGAAACEFMMPLGDMDIESEPAHKSEDAEQEHQGIHIEHYAMLSDPFARMGVLHSVRHNMESRYCGGIFIMNGEECPVLRSSGRKTMPPYFGLMMEDYLMALFPTQMSGGMPCRSVLDSVVTVDRDCAEKREIAAMSNYHAASQTKKGNSRRLSSMKNGMKAGMIALEMARKGCRSCDGHKGHENSWLARYVGTDASQMVDGVGGGRN